MEGERFLYLGRAPWASIWRRRQQLLSRIASQRNMVLYVDPPTSLSTFRQSPEERINLTQRHFGLRKEAENLFVYSPVYPFPLNRVELFNRLNRQLLVGRLKAIQRKLGLERPVLFLNHTFDAHHFFGCFGERLTCYDCTDNYYAYKPIGPEDTDRYWRNERLLASRANLVFVVSEELHRIYSSINPNTYLVPNGADFSGYARAALQETPISKDMADIKHPVLGFVGELKEKIDLELIEQIAISRPEWSVALIGPVVPLEFDLRRFKDRPNVHYLGKKPVSLLPNYLRAIDVCLLPLRESEYNKSVDPLKLYEYLATGKPVVSTNVAPVRRFEELVYVAKDRTEFVRKVEQALAEDSQELRHSRQRVAQENSWDKRVEQIYQLVQAHLMASSPKGQG